MWTADCRCISSCVEFHNLDNDLPLLIDNCCLSVYIKLILGRNTLHFATVPSSGYPLVMHLHEPNDSQSTKRGNNDSHSVSQYYSCHIRLILLISSLLPDHGLHSLPLQQKQLFLARRDGNIRLPSHRPLERTRSEPPPYSHSPLILPAAHHLHPQHHLSQQYAKSFQERFKQNVQLSKVTKYLVLCIYSSKSFFFLPE